MKIWCDNMKIWRWDSKYIKKLLEQGRNTTI